MRSSDTTAKSADRHVAEPPAPDQRGATALPSPLITTTEPAADRPDRPVSKAAPGEDEKAPDARHPSNKLKSAHFDFASANQAHLKSISSMRGKNAGPVKKGPTRR
jgi:hypothetical protein